MKPKTNKDAIAVLREKMFEKKKELQIEEANKKLAKTLTHKVYDIIQDPDTNRREHLIVEIKYNLTKDTKTGKFKVKDIVGTEVCEFENKMVGLSHGMWKEKQYPLFEKNKRRK